MRARGLMLATSISGTAAAIANNDAVLSAGGGFLTACWLGTTAVDWLKARQP